MTCRKAPPPTSLRLVSREGKLITLEKLLAAPGSGPLRQALRAFSQRRYRGQPAAG
jgi:hypothetical protein